jgi:hypothetical protein
MKISKKKLAEYRKSNRNESYGRYDVTLAKFLIENRKSSKVIEINAENLSEKLGFNQGANEERDGYLWFSNAVIDTAHILNHKFDLSKPLIFLPDGTLIDGNHRAYWAWGTGIESLPAIILTEAEAREIDGGRAA